MRLPHREGRSQRKHRDAADSSDQAEGLAVLASRDASGWLVKSSTTHSNLDKWADFLTT